MSAFDLVAFLPKLPPSGRCAGERFDYDMDGIRRDCIVWVWTDMGGVRRGLFAKDTGDYVGDLLVLADRGTARAKA